MSLLHAFYIFEGLLILHSRPLPRNYVYTPHYNRYWIMRYKTTGENDTDIYGLHPRSE